MRIVRRLLGGLGVVTAIPIAALYLYLAIARDPAHFWRPLSRASTTVNGKTVTNALVLGRPDGTLLINLGTPLGWYVYWPGFNNMGSCNTIRTVAFPGWVYTYNCSADDYPCIEMGTAKTEIDARLIALTNSIEFTTIDGKRVLVSW